jgi:glycerophosphoinositol glycerophosphodiesterase
MYAVGGVIAGTGLFVGLAYYAFRLPRPSREQLEQLLPWDKALVIGHRGEAVEAPENTLAAFSVAKSNGVFGVEFDLSFTSDGHPVLLHDDSVDRTTDGSGEINEMTLSQVRKLNAAYYHKLSGEFGPLQVPILEEAIKECLRLNVTMFIDVKEDAAKVLIYSWSRMVSAALSLGC